MADPDAGVSETRLTERRVPPRRTAAERKGVRGPAEWRDAIALPGNGSHVATAPVWEALRSYALPEGASDRRVLRRDAFFRRLLAVVDAASAALALVVAVMVVSPDLVIRPAAALLPPLVVLMTKVV